MENKIRVVSIVCLAFFSENSAGARRVRALCLHEHNSKQTQETKPHFCAPSLFTGAKSKSKTKHRRIQLLIEYNPIKIGRRSFQTELIGKRRELGVSRERYFN